MEKINRRLVFCTDQEELIKRIAMLRKLPVHMIGKKIGMDDGKGSLKLTLTVYDPDDVMLFFYAFLYNSLFSNAFLRGAFLLDSFFSDSFFGDSVFI